MVTVWNKMKKQQFCMKCKRRFPSFFFRRIPVEWKYRKNDRVHYCRFCSFFHRIRYRQTWTKTGMKKLEPYKPTLKQRIKEIWR